MLKMDLDIISCKSDHESDNRWELRKKFMIAHKSTLPKDKLICMSEIFANIELLGCRYQEETMKEIAELSKSLPDEFSGKRKKPADLSIISGTDAVRDKIKRTASNIEATADSKCDDSLTIRPKTTRDEVSEPTSFQEANVAVPNTCENSKQSSTEPTLSELERHKWPENLPKLGGQIGNFILIRTLEPHPFANLTLTAERNGFKLTFTYDKAENSARCNIFLNGDLICHADSRNKTKARNAAFALLFDRFQAQCYTILIVKRRNDEFVNRSKLGSWRSNEEFKAKFTPRISNWIARGCANDLVLSTNFTPQEQQIAKGVAKSMKVMTQFRGAKAEKLLRLSGPVFSILNHLVQNNRSAGNYMLLEPGQPVPSVLNTYKSNTERDIEEECSEVRKSGALALLDAISKTPSACVSEAGRSRGSINEESENRRLRDSEHLPNPPGLSRVYRENFYAPPESVRQAVKNWPHQLEMPSNPLSCNILIYNHDRPAHSMTQTSRANIFPYNCKFTPYADRMRCDIYIHDKLFCTGEGTSPDEARTLACQLLFSELAKQCYTIHITDVYEIVDRNRLNSRGDVADPKLTSNNVGFKMLKMMGWNGGGLGRNSQGITDPVGTTMISGRKGIGCKVDETDFDEKVKAFLRKWKARGACTDLVVKDPTFGCEEWRSIERVVLKSQLRSKSYGNGDQRKLCISKKFELWKTLHNLVKRNGACGKYVLLKPGQPLPPCG